MGAPAMREIISFAPTLPIAMFSMYLSPHFTRASAPGGSSGFGLQPISKRSKPCCQATRSSSPVRHPRTWLIKAHPLRSRRCEDPEYTHKQIYFVVCGRSLLPVSPDEPQEENHEGNADRPYAVKADGSIGGVPGEHQDFIYRFQLLWPKQAGNADDQAELDSDGKG